MPNVCIAFFCVNVCHWTFFKRHCSHDSPVDVVFSHVPRCSVPLCLPFLFLYVVRRGVCVYVYVYVYVCVNVYVYVYMCICVYVYVCLEMVVRVLRVSVAYVLVCVCGMCVLRFGVVGVLCGVVLRGAGMVRNVWCVVSVVCVRGVLCVCGVWVACREDKTKDKMKNKMKEKKTEIMMLTDAESKFAQEKAKLAN